SGRWTTCRSGLQTAISFAASPSGANEARSRRALPAGIAVWRPLLQVLEIVVGIAVDHLVVGIDAHPGRARRHPERQHLPAADDALFREQQRLRQLGIRRV